ncbi:hypothetical protein MCOR25_003292 [Pyricularia grisea]|uniref:Sensitive to high expression protein 9, mitochondrial n=1 Tax=Pyricularia grisea TaxID=148305 RepID=A0A6P8B0M5_PYRGI|nr:uncharacterized protein PgNI_07253 [Pyricularia grisea]KAI6374059.1 hypothetical protein MCOR25_003292 [Pyricularia grisea]TLD08381.1 hypothetical protein PgNI_07253 [Pyricularia grisea]
MASRASLRPLLRPGPKRMLGTLSFSAAAGAIIPTSSISLLLSNPALKPVRSFPTCWSYHKLLLLPCARSFHSGTPLSSTPNSNNGNPSRPSSADTGDSIPIAMPPPEGTGESTAPISSPPEPPSAPPSEQSIETESKSTSSESSNQEQQQEQPSPTTDEPTPSTSANQSTDAKNPTQPLTARITNAIDNLQTRLLAGQQTLNDLTGYSSIEQIKHQNAELEKQLAAAQAHLRHARQAYKTAHSARASTQREVTTLLARKDGWSPLDLERFTTLYRQDHQLETEAQRAARELTEAEDDEARLSAALTNGIMRRYHEEQVWSDRIRRASTWGTWGLMGVNILLFLVLQFVAEPWRRRRLVRSIAEGEKPMMDEVRHELEAVRGALAAFEKTTAAAAAAAEAAPAAEPAALTSAQAVADQVQVVGTTPDEVVVTAGTAPEPTSRPTQPWAEVIVDPKLWGPVLSDLYSERRIDLTMREVSIIALEGALAGAVIFAGAFALLVRN